MIEDILTYDNLYISALKCSKSVKWKNSTAHYLLNLPKETYKLYTSLKDGTYKERPHKEFKVFEPKERDVLSISFRDRIYQRTLNDLVIYPLMTSSFIYDNCACQKGKGTDFARDRVKHHLRRFYVENGSNDGYMIHIDIKKYYPTMSHRVAEALFEERLPEELFLRVKDMLRMYKGDKGYFAGSQLIQILGISMLDKLDHYIKERMHVKHYVRYMDDLILIVKDNPQQYLDEVERQLELIEFKVNKEKTKIVKLYKGDTFLGFTFSLSSTGKVYQCISRANVKRRKRKMLKTYFRQTMSEFENSYNTWRSYADKSTSRKIIYKADELFYNLIRRIEYETRSKEVIV